MSAYGRTKAAGEAAIREAFASATIVRPSIIFGPEDAFFNRFAAMAAVSPALPLIGGGATRFQPVFVGDVARAIANALADPGAPGRTYELGGPAVLTFKELMEVMLREIGRKRLLVPVPFGAAKILGMAGDLMAAVGLPPPITVDQVQSLRVDNVVTPGAPGLTDLGVQPTPLHAVIPTYLYRYRKGGQYADIAMTAPAR